MEKLVLTQVKSAIKRPGRQKATLQALGFRKLNQTVVKEATPQIKGMVRAVQHLLKVEVK